MLCYFVTRSTCFFSISVCLLQAELQLNFQKRRGHGVLSVLRPKFSGVLGEALDVAARWSGDVVSTNSKCSTFSKPPILNIMYKTLIS